MYAPTLIAYWVRALFFPRWWIEDLKGASVGWVQQRRPDCRETMSLKLLPSSNKEPVRDQEAKQCEWGLLLPITSRGTGDVWGRLEGTLRQLVKSVSPSHRHHTKVYVGIVIHDPVFENDEARSRICALLRELGGAHFEEPLVPAFQGKICWIWAELAAQAVADGAERFVLLGDDVLVHSHGWQCEVE